MTDRYSPGSMLRQLWDSLPSGEFICISDLPSFNLSHKTVILKVKNSLASVALSEQPLSKLPFGTLCVVTCENLTVAYQITVPTCKIKVGVNFSSFARKDVPSLDFETYFADRTLAVIGNSDALLVVSNRQYWTCR
jgi:hypothetical protein